MTLKFAEPLETRFRRDYFEHAIGTIRLGLLLGCTLYVAFLFLDEWMLPLTKDVTFRIRLGLAVPVLTGAFVLSFTRWFERHLEVVLSVTIVIAAGGIALMIAFAHPSEPGFSSYAQGLTLAVVFTFSLLRLRFVATTVSSILIVASYEVVALVVHDVAGGDMLAMATFVSTNFFLVSTTLVSMVAGYTLEYYARGNFLQRLRIEEENRRVQETLQELETREAQIVQSERMAALGNLVAGLVHELSSPVGAVDSGCETTERILRRMADGAERNDASEEERHLALLRECVRTVREAVSRISELLRSLKKFSHLDGASFGFVDLHESLEATLTLLALEMGDRVSIEREYGSIPKIACYPADLNQLFMNVLRNAVEAIPGRGTIRLATWTEERKVRIRIVDDGVGMTAEQLGTLFVPTFSRSGERVKAGLGLFVSYRIAEKHQGRLEVESEVGRGTKVTLSIPLDLDLDLERERERERERDPLTAG